ncbi:MAG: hypothetical protein RLZZ293_621 [Pseudomonadota bacterium]|jgi:uncharacterized protein YcfL
MLKLIIYALGFNLIAGCAANCIEANNGSLTMAKQTLNCINAKGYTNLTEINVRDLTNAGFLNLTQSKVTTLNSRGDNTIDNSIFDTLDSRGKTKLTNIKAINLVAAGQVNLAKSTVANVDIQGDGQINDSSLTNLQCNGECVLKQTKIAQQMHIRGSLTMINSSAESIQINAKQINLSNSNIKHDIVILKNNQQNQPQYLSIDGGQVDGNIIFMTNQGIVTLSHNPLIRGKIIGAKLIKN